MRFLQTEWHRHERDRNAWEIERAEMKARIARLEGENRSSKKLQESLSRHVQMMESVLRKEREKLRTLEQKTGVNADPEKGVAELKRKLTEEHMAQRAAGEEESTEVKNGASKENHIEAVSASIPTKRELAQQDILGREVNTYTDAHLSSHSTS